MQRFILSTFSILLATAALAPTAQALPKLDSDFNIQTMRLSELDVRNKSDEGSQQPYYPQSTTESWSQEVTAAQESTQTPKSTEWEASERSEEDASTTLSLTERRHQSLERN